MDDADGDSGDTAPEGDGGRPHRPVSGSTVVLAAAIVASIGFRLINLVGLPGEMYGDIAIVHEYVEEIRRGNWPTSFTLSSGPLYHYLIMPVVWVGGSGFTSLKIASVAVSALVLWATYLYAKEVADQRVAATSLFVAGVSSWLLVFSRLGNSQIVTAVVVMAALYFAARVARRDARWSAAACGAMAGLGMYGYPQSFVVAPTVFVVLVLLWRNRSGVRGRDIGVFVVAVVVTAMPFLIIVAADPVNFTSGYIGGKIQSRTGTLETIAHNAWRALLALHVDGDVVFRSNPAGAPHLDALSGLLFVLGVGYWLAPQRRRWWPVVLLPLVLLQIPSMLVLASESEVPSASRTVLVAPLVYVVTASGLCWLAAAVHRSATVRRVVAATLLCLVAVVNGQRYVGAYADGLPNKNVPFGRIIADSFADLPDGTHAFIVGCCWGEYGQPEPKGITYLDAGPVATGMIELARDTLDCAQLAGLPRPAVLVWSPANDLPAPALAACPDGLDGELHIAGGYPVFRSVILDRP